MGNAEYNKNITAAEYDAIRIVQAQNPRFQKIEGEQLKSFYEWFEKIYRQGEKSIDPQGQKVVIFGNNMVNTILWGRKHLQAYYNLRGSYEKSVHLLAASFGNILAGVQFGFKNTNPDVEIYSQRFLEESRTITSLLKAIEPHLKLKYVPKRILKIYHDDFNHVSHFAVTYGEELAK